MCTELVSSIIAKVQSKVKACPSVEFFWIDDQSTKKNSFTALVQVSFDKSSTILRANKMVLHSVHVLVMNTALKLRRFLISNGILLVGFLPVDKHIDGRFDAKSYPIYTGPCEIVPFGSSVVLTASSSARRLKLPLLNSAI